MLAARFEWHYTPPHGSWLNLAECELSVLALQCLNRRFSEQTQVAAEFAPWCGTGLRIVYTVGSLYTLLPRLKTPRPPTA